MGRSLLAAIALLGLSALAAADPGKHVVGYLGQANRPTWVYAAPNSHSRRYSPVKNHQYLVIQQYSPTWDKVLLVRGVYGFVKYATVEHLPYEFTNDKVPRSSRGSINPFPQGDLMSRSDVANYAINFIGRVPYRWGGTDVNSGIDCSGFVQKMYGRIGVNLPRTAVEQARVGQPIYRLEELQPGDRLYFYEARRGMIGHTGIYLGKGMFIHSSHGKGGVATSALTPSWLRILVAARR